MSRWFRFCSNETLKFCESYPLGGLGWLLVLKAVHCSTPDFLTLSRFRGLSDRIITKVHSSGHSHRLMTVTPVCLKCPTLRVDTAKPHAAAIAAMYASGAVAGLPIFSPCAAIWARCSAG